MVSETDFVSVSLNVNDGTGFLANIQLCISKRYPEVAPDISVNCPALTKSEFINFKHDLLTECEILKGQPMCLDVIEWTKKHIHEYRGVQSATPDNQDVNVAAHLTVVLQLDHMRNKVKYTKTLKKWTAELGINGALVFYGHLIYVMLHGIETSVKNFIKRLKTENVDVDSRGRNCKERMMSCIHEEISSQRNSGITKFEIKDLQSKQEIEEYLKSIELGHLADVIK